MSVRDITKHKQTEEELKASEEQYRALVETTGTGYVIIDTDDRVLDANPEYVRLTGYHTLEEIIGRSVVEWTAGYEKEKNAEAVKKCARDGYIRNLEIDYVDSTGKIIPVEINATVVQTKGTPRILTVCRDITVRKAAEEAVAEALEVNRAIVNSSPVGIITYKTTGKCISANEAAAKILSTTVDRLKEQNFHHIQSWKESGLYEPAMKTLTSQQTSLVQVNITTTFGFHQWLDVIFAPFKSGGEPHLMVMFSDIIDHKRAEEALLQSEERYRTLAEATPDWIFIIGKDDTIKYANIASLKMFRRPYDQVIGKSRKDLFPPAIADAQGILLQKVFETGEPVRKEEIIQFGKQEFWIDTSLVPLKDVTGNVTAVLGVSRDITERRRNEEALRENELRYRSLFEGAAEGILVADIETKKFLHANLAMGRMLGYSEEELTTLGVEDIHPKESLDHVISEFMARARGEKTLAMNIPLLRKDKTILYADISTTHIFIDGKMRNVGFFSDITERKRAEETLRKTNEYLHKLIDFANAPIIVWEPSFTISLFNHAFERLTGRTEQEVIGQHLEILFPEESRDASLALIKKTLEGERWESVKIPILAVDGTVHTVLWNSANILTADAKLVSTIAQGVDITERERVEDALLESEEQFRVIFHNQPAGLLMIDPSTHMIVDTNAATLAMIGASREEVIGRVCHTFICPAEQGKCPITDLNQVVDNSERVLITKNGRRIPILKSVNSITIKGRRFLIESFIDITEQKRAEEIIKKFNEELEQQVKFRTKELDASLQEKVVLLREVHHRVKNNLQIIISLVNLQMRQINDQWLKQVMAETQNRVRAMSFVHEKLYQSENLSHIDLSEYIRFLTAQLFAYYGIDSRKIRLDIDIGKTMVDINTAIPLGLIINELVSNALKHAFPSDREGTITISSRYDDKVLSLAIRDDGIGLPPDLDWKNPESLGLRLVNSLVDQLEGTIELGKEKGTTFIISMHREIG